MIYFLSVGFINIFPDVSLSDSVSSSVATASTYISGLNVVLPVATILTIMGLFLTIEGVILLIKIINWFIRKIPGIN